MLGFDTQYKKFVLSYKNIKEIGLFTDFENFNTIIEEYIEFYKM